MTGFWLHVLAVVLLVLGGAVLGTRWLAPWTKWHWPALGKAIFGALAFVLVGCSWPVPTEGQVPAPPQLLHIPTGYHVAATVPCNVIPEAGFKLQTSPALFRVATDPARGSVCQTTVPAGWGSNGTSPVTYFLLLPKPKPRDLYVSYWTKLSPAWVGCSNGYKQLVIVAANGVKAFPRLIGFASQAGFTAENPTNKATGNYPFPVAKGVTLSRDTWHFVEMRLTGDGHVTHWVDNQLVVDGPIRGFTGSTTYTQVQWQPIRGGGCNAVNPATQYQYLDDLTVWVP